MHLASYSQSRLRLTPSRLRSIRNAAASGFRSEVMVYLRIKDCHYPPPQGKSKTFVVYYESTKRELKIRCICETRLIDEMFANAMGGYVT